MPLFLFKDIEEKSGEAASNQFGISTRPVVIEDSPLPSLAVGKQPFVILGHTQEVIYDYALWKSKKQTLGGLSAAEMAQRFEKMIAKESRGQLKHLYLIACESGLNDSQAKPCYARELACELFRKGFIGVAVHTVTSPALQGTPYVGMRVELVTHVGIEGKIEGLQPGHARAFMTTPNYERVSQEICELEEELRGVREHSQEAVKRRSMLNRQILSRNRQLQAESRNHLILDVADLKEELHRPENTFLAKASLKDIDAQPKQLQTERDRVMQQQMKRRVRPLVSRKVQDEVYGPLIEQACADERLLMVLGELSELQRRYRNDKKYSKNIACLVTAMKNKQPNWQQAMFEKMDKYHQLSLIERVGTKRSTSSFYDLMLHLVREHRLVRTDVTPGLDETIKQCLPNRQVEHVIFNKNKEKLDITLVLNDEKKVTLVEFSLHPQELGNLSSPLIQKKIEKGAKREEENKKAFTVGIPAPNQDKPAEEENLKPVPAHQLPTAGHYYHYKNRHHFWPAAITKGQFKRLHGDELKQAILTDFKQKIEACHDTRSLKQCKGMLRKTSEFRVLSMAQDPWTRFFSGLSWIKTSSEKALNRMLSDQESYLNASKKIQ